MSVAPMPRPKRPNPRPLRSHEDIYDRIEESDRKAEDAAHRTDLLTQTVQRVEKKLDDLLKTIGGEAEDDRDEKIGTGLVGRVMRLETKVSSRFSQYYGWVKLVVGFTAADAIFIPAMWWLTSGKLEAVLK